VMGRELDIRAAGAEVRSFVRAQAEKRMVDVR
jgi:hypothetical protein